MLNSTINIQLDLKQLFIDYSDSFINIHFGDYK